MASSKCYVCREGFVGEDSLGQHFMKVHGDLVEAPRRKKVVQCRSCSRQYATFGRLANHVERVHKCGDEESDVSSDEDLKPYLDWINSSQASGKHSNSNGKVKNGSGPKSSGLNGGNGVNGAKVSSETSLKFKRPRLDVLEADVDPDPATKRLPCDVCDESFPVFSDLLAHMRDHLDFGEFDCVDCELRLSSEREHFDHLYEVHVPNSAKMHWKKDGNGVYRLVENSKSKAMAFPKQPDQKHILDESNRNHNGKITEVRLGPSAIARNVMANNPSLKITIPKNGRRSTKQTFKCDECGKNFTNAKRRNQHATSHVMLRARQAKFATAQVAVKPPLPHPPPPPPSSVNENSSAKPPQPRVTVKPKTSAVKEPKRFECELCPAYFKRRDSLRKHVSNVHEKGIRDVEKRFVFGQSLSPESKKKAGDALGGMELEQSDYGVECKPCGICFEDSAAAFTHFLDAHNMRSSS